MGFGYPDTYARLAGIPSSDPIPDPDALWPMLLEAIGDSFGPYLPAVPRCARSDRGDCRGRHPPGRRQHRASGRGSIWRWSDPG